MEKRIAEDFPVDWLEDQFVSRREFVKFLTMASGGMAAASAGLAVWARIPRRQLKFERSLIARIDDVPIGGWRQFAYPRESDPCILVRTSESAVAAFSRRCTHLSCPVIWQPKEARLYCPCHEGAFSVVDGHVLQGPPARALPQIELSIEEGSIYATGVLRGEA